MNKSRVQECELCFTNQLDSGEPECEQECEISGHQWQMVSG